MARTLVMEKTIQRSDYYSRRHVQILQWENYRYKSGELWILSDSRSALQHLSGWSSADDETSISILLKLKKISQNHDVHLQWIPSHVNISGNEVADRLAKEGSEGETATGSSLTHQELYSNEGSKLNLIWCIPLVHQWYTGTSPGTLLNVIVARGLHWLDLKAAILSL